MDSKTLRIRLGVAGLAMILLTSAYYRTQSVPVMTAAANAFLNSLTPDQRQEQLSRMQSELDSLLRGKLGEQAYAVFQARGIEYWLPN